MIKTVYALIGCAALCAARPLAAQQAADEPFHVNRELARAGRKVWSSKGCMSCHTIGRTGISAPDLNGLYDRRSADWVRRWLADPGSMLDSDTTAQTLLAEWNGLNMPDMKLTPEEIEMLMHYIAEQQKPRRTPSP